MEDDTPLIDIEALDSYLLSDLSPDECMMLSDLDGFLAGIVVGPELILPSEWLTVIWGGGEPQFESPKQMQTILGTIMGRYNEIIAVMNTDPSRFEPIYWQGPTAIPSSPIGPPASSMPSHCAARHGSRCSSTAEPKSCWNRC